MPDRAPVTHEPLRLPDVLKSLVADASERQQRKNEQRRSALDAEIQAARKEFATQRPNVVAAAEQAAKQRDERQAEFDAARQAYVDAIVARDGQSLGHDAYVGPRLNEIRGLADPRLAAFLGELEDLREALRKIDPTIWTDAHRVPDDRIDRMGYVRVIDRVRSNVPSIRRRADAIWAAMQAVILAQDTAGIDVEKLIAKLRASIPEIGDEEVTYDREAARAAERVAPVPIRREMSDVDDETMRKSGWFAASQPTISADVATRRSAK